MLAALAERAGMQHGKRCSRKRRNKEGTLARPGDRTLALLIALTTPFALLSQVASDAMLEGSFATC